MFILGSPNYSILYFFEINILASINGTIAIILYLAYSTDYNVLQFHQYC